MSHGIRIERVISDNAFCYRNSRAFKTTAADLGIVQKFIRPHCPWTNGKVERLNRTLATEWAYASALELQRRTRRRLAHLARALQPILSPTSGIGGMRPIDRVNNATSQYI